MQEHNKQSQLSLAEKSITTICFHSILYMEVCKEKQNQKFYTHSVLASVQKDYFKLFQCFSWSVEDEVLTAAELSYHSLRNSEQIFEAAFWNLLLFHSQDL